MTEQEQLALVARDATLIEHVENPTEETQLRVVREHGYYIQFIKNPTERVQLEAIRQAHGAGKLYVMYFIEHPTKQAQILGIQLGADLRDIKNLSPGVERLAPLLAPVK